MTTIATARRASIMVTGIAGAVLLAACSSSTGGSTKASGAAPSTGAAPTTSSSAAQQAAGPATSETASLTEFHIALSSKTLTAGSYTFRVKNAGSITHALTIDGPGVSDKSTGDLSPGGASSLTVTLKPGSYEVFCPVGNHKMEGMDETVKVT